MSLHYQIFIDEYSKGGIIRRTALYYSYKSEIQHGKPEVMTLLNNFALPFHFFAKGTHYKSETTKKSNQILFLKNAILIFNSQT